MKVIATNRRARHDYFILETYEAGLALVGSEVKSLRGGMVSLKEGFARVEGGEVFLYDVHIATYDKSSVFVPDPKRPRKLLLNKPEIKRLYGKTQERGLTLVPLRMYFNNRGLAKVELGLARGKKKYDKRAALRERELEREAQKDLRRVKRS